MVSVGFVTNLLIGVTLLGFATVYHRQQLLQLREQLRESTEKLDDAHSALDNIHRELARLRLPRDSALHAGTEWRPQWGEEGEVYVPPLQ